MRRRQGWGDRGARPHLIDVNRQALIDSTEPTTNVDLTSDVPEVVPREGRPGDDRPAQRLEALPGYPGVVQPTPAAPFTRDRSCSGSRDRFRGAWVGPDAPVRARLPASQEPLWRKYKAGATSSSAPAVYHWVAGFEPPRWAVASQRHHDRQGQADLPAMNGSPDTKPRNCHCMIRAPASESQCA